MRGESQAEAREEITQPFRSTLLCRLASRERQMVESFGDLLEAALLEAFDRSYEEPFSLTLSRATYEDLLALVDHQRFATESWSRSRGETSEKLRSTMQQVQCLLLAARDMLSVALRDEEVEHEGSEGGGDG